MLEVFHYWRQVPLGTEPPWLEKDKQSCMRLDCCRLMGRWNPCAQHYFQTKTLGTCGMKISSLTWNPTMCHQQKAVIAGSLPFRCYFLHDLAQHSRHVSDNVHQVCLGQQMLGMVRSMLAEALLFAHTVAAAICWHLEAPRSIELMT